MEVNGVAVMRRRNDSWLNATQILKVAGIEKGKRTKVLEKEILIGEHEKVQGGYGKYQGTWIKFEKGLAFCRQYGVEELLKPLLTYDMGQDGSNPGQGGMDTPTKEQAMAANRKRMYNSTNEARLSQSGTFFKNISQTASHAVAAISKARFDSPNPRRNSVRPPTFSRTSSQQHMDENAFPASQQSMASYASDQSYNMNGYDSAYATQTGPQYSHMGSQNDFQEPPRKRMRATPSVSMSQNDGTYEMQPPPSPTEVNDQSFMYGNQANMMDLDGPPVAQPPLPYADTPQAESKRALLMSLFMDPSRTDFTTHEAFMQLSGPDLDMPIDSTYHTALHWAATLARLPLLRALIKSGGSIYRVNGSGETALMRSCAVTNNLDFSSFPDLLDLLGPTIEMRDSRGRTVLHHIAVTSAVKGRSQASKYYLESLLEFVVRQGSAPSSQNQQQQTNMFLPQHGRSMGIGRFMSEIVNAQDRSGETALNIAARVGNRSIISQLLEVGADAGIPNNAGLRPVDFGIGDPEEVALARTSPSKPRREGKRESSGEIIDGVCPSVPFPQPPNSRKLTIILAITNLLSATHSEFATELSTKQSQIDAVHHSLRNASAHLGEERRKLERLQTAKSERNERKWRFGNLQRAERDEGYRLQQLLQRHGRGSEGETDMYLGAADSSILAIPIDPATSTVIVDLSAPLPSASEIRGKISAYKNVNAELESKVSALKARSRDVEAKYRRVIALCTKTEEGEVDKSFELLERAVLSEGEVEFGDVEVGRVREFLARLEGV
jgi:ankyrin repeat protein